MELARERSRSDGLVGEGHVLQGAWCWSQVEYRVFGDALGQGLLPGLSPL